MRLLLSAACLLALSGCAIIVNGNDDVQVKSVFNSDAVVGDGHLAHERRAVGSVSALDVSGPLEVNVRVGPAPSLEVDADSNLLPLIRTEVSGGALRMWVAGNVRSNNSLRVTYTVPALTQVRASGSGRLTVSELNGAPLDFSKSGSGTAQLSGRVGRLDVQQSGSGQVNASALRTGDANLNLNGSGRMSLGQVQGGALTANVRRRFAQRPCARRGRRHPDRAGQRAGRPDHQRLRRHHGHSAPRAGCSEQRLGPHHGVWQPGPAQRQRQARAGAELSLQEIMLFINID
jgi:hypothetical protein